ncbi:MAG: hypothetical protein QM796_16590 [Chthoniobacteraceae bacterium]
MRFGTVDCYLEAEGQAQPAPVPAAPPANDATRQQIESLLMARDALHSHNQELIKQRDTAKEAVDELNRKGFPTGVRS